MMVKVKNKAILGLFMLVSCQVQTAPTWLKKAGHIAADAGATWGFGYQNPIGDPTTYASIRTAEDANEHTFSTLNKPIPFLLLAAMSYGAATAFQYLDFDVLIPDTGYATGFGLTMGYLSYEQIDMWMKRFVDAQLPWQQEDEETFNLESVEIAEVVGQADDAPSTPRGQIMNPDDVSPEGSPDSQTGLTGSEKKFQRTTLKKLRSYLSVDTTKRARKAVHFGTIGTLAIVMRHYFGDETGIVPQIKFAELISELMEIAPRFKTVPMNTLLKAVEIGALYGASYGFQALDKYLMSIQPQIAGPEGEPIYWQTNLGAVTTWAAVITLAKSLKLFTTDSIDLITDAPEEDAFTQSTGGNTEAEGSEFDVVDLGSFDNSRASMDVEVSGDAYQEETFKPGLFSRCLKGCKNGFVNTAKRTRNFVAQSGRSIAKHTIRCGALAGASVATSCRALGFVANLRLAEYINELALCLPQPRSLKVSLCGRKVTIPVKVLKNFIVTGALYGASYAVAMMDEYLLAEYGVTSELSTAFIWSSIMNFSDNIKKMIEDDEDEEEFEGPFDDVELTSYPEQ
jgi:hypothetical protein